MEFVVTSKAIEQKPPLDMRILDIGTFQPCLDQKQLFISTLLNPIHIKGYIARSLFVKRGGEKKGKKEVQTGSSFVNPFTS